jgi:hypothetical protein
MQQRRRCLILANVAMMIYWYQHRMVVEVCLIIGTPTAGLDTQQHRNNMLFWTSTRKGCSLVEVARPEDLVLDDEGDDARLELRHEGVLPRDRLNVL